MVKWLIGTVPDWLQKKHPIMHYLLARDQKTTRTARVIGFLALLFILVLFGMMGYANASQFFEQNPFELPFSTLLFEFLFWSILIFQVGIAISSLLPPMSFINEEKSKATWDVVRATHNGINLILRARWGVATFYRLRPALALLWVARGVLLLGLLYDLTAFQGEYLQNLSANITPDLPPVVVLILVTLAITASMLMPITAVGFNVALGLWLSTWVNKRIYVALLQTFLVLFQSILAGGFAILFLSVRDEQVISQTLLRDGGFLQVSTGILWVLLLGFAIFADWGVSFLYLGFFAGVVWAKIPYGIFLGAVALGFVLIQAFLTDRLIAWAIHRAERNE